MGGMEPYRTPPHPAVLGDLAYIAALALFVFLQRLAWRLKAEEAHAWWVSNGRDVANGLAVITLSVAIWLQGITAHLALAFGASLTLALTVLHGFLEGRLSESWKLSWILAALLGAPLVLVPAAAAAGADRFLSWAFPG